MFKKDFLAVFATIMLILPGTIAYAHGKNRDAAAFFFLKKAAIDLPQVIEGVEKEKNGRVISFKIEQKEDHPIQYEMKILKDSKVFEAIVDPRSGKVLKTESRGLFSHFSDDLKNVPSTTKLSLKDAISIVESHYGGEALRGNFQRNSITKMFRIRMANNEVPSLLWLTQTLENCSAYHARKMEDITTKKMKNKAAARHQPFTFKVQ